MGAMGAQSRAYVVAMAPQRLGRDVERLHNLVVAQAARDQRQDLSLPLSERQQWLRREVLRQHAEQCALFQQAEQHTADARELLCVCIGQRRHIGIVSVWHDSQRPIDPPGGLHTVQARVCGQLRSDAAYPLRWMQPQHRALPREETYFPLETISHAIPHAQHALGDGEEYGQIRMFTQCSCRMV